MSDPSSKLILCPYCGCTQPASDRCAECGGLFEPLSRRATQIAMGPWFIRDKSNPFRPGCSYEVLKRQVRAGKIKPTTVMRGPTTRQFWTIARHVPGVAHLLGYCHRCGAKAVPESLSCAACLEPFREVSQRDELGLMYPTAAEAGAAQRLLDREIALFTGEPVRGPAPGPMPRGVGATGGMATGVDLLDEVVGEVSSRNKPVKHGHGNAKSHASPPPPPVKPEPLSFTPSDDSAAPDENAMAIRTPKPGSQNLLIWLLIAVILAMMAILVMMFLNEQRQAAQNTPGPAVQIPELLPPEPVAVARAPSLFESTIPTQTPADAQPVEPQEEAAPIPPAPPEPPAAPESAPVAESPAIEPPNPQSSKARRAEITRLLADVRKLQEQNRYPEALAKLKEVAALAKPEERPKNLDQVMRAIEDEISRQKQQSRQNFFGISTR
jgi:hypothetical protein